MSADEVKKIMRQNLKNAQKKILPNSAYQLSISIGHYTCTDVNVNLSSAFGNVDEKVYLDEKGDKRFD